MITINEIKTPAEYNNFINIEDNVLRIVKLGAEWCGPCRALSNVFRNLDENKTGNVMIAEIDVEDTEMDDIVTSLNIRSIPVTLLFKNGNMLEKRVGGISETDVYKLIENNK
jgi:thioredoxin 1